ncbi:popeye domain-containing protein 3-like [Amphiura filiformis]|uniref:popeye domain-containing protein 3-like n=1 Tax=Amphiura filiformis TaxID=82378 RepID=UPI003B219659
MASMAIGSPALSPPYIANTEPPNVDIWASTAPPDMPDDTYQTGLKVSCTTWEPIQNIVFQFAYVILFVSYVIPPSSLTATFAMHIFLILGFLCYACWGWLYECSLDIFIWNLLFATLNLCHAVYIAIRIRPVRLTGERSELYDTIFKPFRVPKHTFVELCQYGKISSLKIGEHYAEEGKTRCNRLSILISGKVKVFCEGEFLHAIQDKQFLDSPEWDSFTHGQECDRFQITLTATLYCRYISWPRDTLLEYLESEPYVKQVFENLIGNDITKKLYLLTEKHLNTHGARADIRLPSAARELPSHHDLKGHFAAGPMGACGIGIPILGMSKPK